jgi:hypothetical protein
MTPSVFSFTLSFDRQYIHLAADHDDLKPGSARLVGRLSRYQELGPRQKPFCFYLPASQAAVGLPAWLEGVRRARRTVQAFVCTPIAPAHAGDREQPNALTSPHRNERSNTQPRVPLQPPRAGSQKDRRRDCMHRNRLPLQNHRSRARLAAHHQPLPVCAPVLLGQPHWRRLGFGRGPSREPIGGGAIGPRKTTESHQRVGPIRLGKTRGPWGGGVALVELHQGQDSRGGLLVKVPCIPEALDDLLMELPSGEGVHTRGPRRWRAGAHAGQRSAREVLARRFLRGSFGWRAGRMHGCVAVARHRTSPTGKGGPLDRFNAG